jgi:transcriptional regulator with XRE-family HTH domain
MTQKKNREEIIQRLREIIKDRQISQAEFAKQGKISAGTIRNILTGNSSPTVSALIAWSENLSIDLHWLLLGQGTMYRLATPQPDSTRDPRENLLDKAVALLREHGGSDEEIREAVRLILAGGENGSGPVASLRQFG